MERDFDRRLWEEASGGDFKPRDFGMRLWDETLGGEFGRRHWEETLGEDFGKRLRDETLGGDFGRRLTSIKIHIKIVKSYPWTSVNPTGFSSLILYTLYKIQYLGVIQPVLGKPSPGVSRGDFISVFWGQNFRSNQVRIYPLRGTSEAT